MKRIAIACALGLVVGGCSLTLSNDGGGGGGDNGDFSPQSCPSSDVFTGATCIDSEKGGVCPGTVVCDCGDAPAVSVDTGCRCVDDADGASFVCDDDCSNACPVPQDEPLDPATAVDSICARMAALDCEGDFQIDEAQCRDTFESTICDAWNDYLECARDAEPECVDMGMIDPAFRGIWGPDYPACDPLRPAADACH